MVVKVTLEDIGRGGITPHGNPIALALQRQTKDRHVRVSLEPFQEPSKTNPNRYYWAAVFPRTNCEHRILLPQSAIEFMESFENEDKIEPLKPFEFELDYTYRTAGEEYLHKRAMQKIWKKNKNSS